MYRLFLSADLSNFGINREKYMAPAAGVCEAIIRERIGEILANNGFGISRQCRRAEVRRGKVLAAAVSPIPMFIDQHCISIALARCSY
jgi:hypothetical protein